MTWNISAYRIFEKKKKIYYHVSLIFVATEDGNTSFTTRFVP